ncbi:MAG: PAS domain S-box protein, partial [Chloroflexi bacterium]|nr:PAS domain S-box protein [Chloroflexota bacterium]
SLIESNIDALMTTDPLGIITDVNQQMEALTGYGREELIGTPFKTFFTDPPHAEDGIRLVLREGRVTNYELTARSKDGRETVVSYNATTFRDAAGKLQGVFAAARDVTEQKALDVQLREQQRYLRGLIESSVDGLVTVDPDGFVSDVNAQLCRMTGYAREELIGTPFADYFTEPERARAGVQQTFDQGVVTEYALTIISRTRRLLQVSVNASVFKDAAGQVKGIFASARDITDRVRLEEQLREQQTYLRGLIESSVDGLVTVDPDGFISDVNAQLCRMTGYARETLVGTPFKQYFTERDRADLGVRRTFAEGVVTNYELVLLTKAGHKRTVSFNASVFRTADGQIQGIFASARDISEQARLQTQLAEQQAYNRSLIEASADALFAIAPDGAVTDVNEETTRLTGYSRKHLINSRFADLFTEPERAREGVQQTLAAGRVLGYELVLITRYGRRTAVSFSAGVFTDAAGEALGVLAGARDITEQKQLEQELRNQQFYARSLIESNIDALMTTDPLGIITDVNQQMEALTGGTREELIGTPFKQYFTDPQRAEEGVKLVLQEGKVTNYELTARARDGRETVVSYNAATFRDRDDKLQGVFAAARDVTEQKALEGQLQGKNEELEEQYRRIQEANRLKSEFLANMSHELRTPLNGIIGFSELMHDEKVGPLSDAHHEYLGYILSSSRHLLQLINDVLDLAKVESGKLEFQPEPVDPARLVREVQEVVQSLAAKKRLRLGDAIAPGLGQLLVDPGKLKQVLYNYLSNAIKFTPDEGQVTVRLQPEGAERFRLEVVDTGIGIKPEDLGRLFVEFQQLDASTAKKYQGTGLGLALTKRIVEAQGGEVGVHSTPGQGSTFWAILPRIAHTAPTTHTTEAPAAARTTLSSAARAAHDSGTSRPDAASVPAGAPTVLVVEDDLQDQAWLVQVLAAAGFATVTATSGAQAQAQCRARRFDAITLDLFLPDVSGWHVLHALRARGANQKTPVLVVTIARDRELAAGFPIQDYLVKPVDAQALVAALRRAGASPDGNQTVLVVDDDPTTLRVAEETLARRGFRPICRMDAMSALAAATDERTAAVVLDLLMPGMDGFEFLARFRRDPENAHTPVIVWTNKDLTAADRRWLEDSAQAVVEKRLGGVGALVEVLRSHVAVAHPGGNRTVPSGDVTTRRA